MQGQNAGKGNNLYSHFRKKIFKVSIHCSCVLRFPPILAGWRNMWRDRNPVNFFLEMTVWYYCRERKKVLRVAVGNFISCESLPARNADAFETETESDQSVSQSDGDGVSLLRPPIT